VNLKLIKILYEKIIELTVSLQNLTVQNVTRETEIRFRCFESHFIQWPPY